MIMPEDMRTTEWDDEAMGELQKNKEVGKWWEEAEGDCEVVRLFLLKIQELRRCRGGRSAP